MSSAHTRGRLATCLPLVLLACLALSCDHGLSPEMARASASETPGFEGTITVTSRWPAADSLMDLRVVAIRVFPPTNILQEYLNGTLLFSDKLVLNQDTQTYTLRMPGLSGVFQYVAVAQQYAANPFADWRVVGVYTTTGNPAAHAPVDLGAGLFRRGIDITVDFINLPPQPF